MNTPEHIITLSEGTELNFGPWEDSDSIVTLEPIKVCKRGERQNGAIPVSIVGPDGNLDDEIFFFHQPEQP